MIVSLRQTLVISTAILGCALTAGCGGGGGVHSTPTPPTRPPPTPTPSPTPAPSPTPTPAPTPTPSTYDTSEYRATVGAVSAHALAAYQEGATGRGIKVGIIDSGIDLQSEEFPGRIDAASADTAAKRGIDDVGGHGTAVAFTLAGRRNGTGTHGIAFDASLIVLRTDAPGTCADTSEDGGCSFEDPAIAKGIDIATKNGARVINMSLGGSEPDSNVVAAINRATAKGVIVVIAAGNDSKANPDPFAAIATDDTDARNLVVIAGSVGPGDTLSDFSDKAGTGADHYLAAVGYHVRAPNESDEPYLWDGTSFAAPQISGAVALLAQAFPNLSGAQIVRILFDSARDAGAAGLDKVYGHGILDLTRAFQPLGTSSVAGTKAAMSTETNAALSAPMGDARQGALGAVILDGFDRAFAIDLARTIGRSGPNPVLTGALEGRTRTFGGAAGAMSVALTIAPGTTGARIERTTLGYTDATRARAIAGMVAQRLGSRASFAIGFSESAHALGAQLAGHSDPAFLVARDPANEPGFLSDVGGAAVVRRDVAGWGLTAGIENGAVLTRGATGLPAVDARFQRSDYDRLSLTIDRRIGPVAAALSMTRLDEADSVLGARFGAGLGSARATTWFLDASARIEAGGGWSLGGSLRRGWTQADLRSGLTGTGALTTGAFAANIGKTGLFDSGDRAGLRIAQPLRVATGGIDYRLPVGYDYGSTRVTDWSTERLNLAPTGREIDVEALYARAIGDGDLQTNLFWRRDPGNFAALGSDYGAALRYAIGF